ncbi:hypothetical protein GCM10023187_19890 [Nibrella viscosa]|uniref:Uncharacterized protein n=1 Tax=Nibrella viscosa TaxID=1084524 RepID=A0ABP8KD03_9BACT
MRAFFKIAIINIVVCYVLIEVTSWAVIQTGYIPARKPSFTPTQYDRTWIPPFADINPEWGVWHLPSVRTHYQNTCFRINYVTNSYGARDRERTKTGDTNRIVVLGDSFMEGFGVEEADRFSTLLEKKTGAECLNFATSGGFGPTQYYLVYKHLAKQFAHNRLIVGVLPANDFVDDKVAFGDAHYRPFWNGTYPKYELAYSLPDVNQSDFTPDKQKQTIETTSYKLYEFLKAYTYWFNIVNYYRQRGGEPTSDLMPSYFYDYSAEELNKLKYSLKQIREEAGDKEVLVLLIPIKSDFIRFGQEKRPTSRLYNELSSFCREQQVQLLDLLAATDKQEDVSDLFISCDGHWSEYGNAYYASLLTRYLSAEPAKDTSLVADRNSR